MSRDPLAGKFPWQSPYVSMDNNPIKFNDPLGDKVKYAGRTWKQRMKVRWDVFKARIMSRTFRRDFRRMKSRDNETYIFQRLRANDNSENIESQSVSTSVEGSYNRAALNGNGRISGLNSVGVSLDGNPNDDRTESFHLNYRIVNTETVKGKAFAGKNTHETTFRGRKKSTKKSFVGSVNVRVRAESNSRDFNNGTQTVLTHPRARITIKANDQILYQSNVPLSVFWQTGQVYALDEQVTLNISRETQIHIIMDFPTFLDGTPIRKNRKRLTSHGQGVFRVDFTGQ